jgi:hypothetical protein
MTQAPTARTSRTWVWAFALLLLLAFRLPSLEQPAGGDQGLYSYVAQRVIDGDVPYRDAWEQKPPAIFFVYAAMWRAFPHESIVALADLIVAGAIAMMLVLVGRRTFGGRVGEGAATLFLLLGDPGIQRLAGMHVRGQCETFVALAVTASLGLAWRDRPSRLAAFAAGIGIALAFWLKYNAIAFALPVGLAAVWSAAGPFDRRRAVRTLGWLAAGALGASLLVMIYFAAGGALADLWLGTVVYNVRYSGETYTGPLDVVWYGLRMPVERARVDGLWFVGLLGALLLIVFRRTERSTAVAIAWIAAAVVSIVLNGARGLPQYFLQALPALALAGSAGLAAMWQARRRAPVPALATAALVAAGAWRVGIEPVAPLQPRLFGIPQAVDNAAFDLGAGSMDRSAYLGRFDLGEAGKFSVIPVERLVRHAIDSTGTEQPIYVFGFASGAVLAGSGRESASRFFWSRPVVLEFAAERAGYGSAGLLADLQRKPPALVALQKHDWGLAEASTPDSIQFFMNHPALRAWLEAGYALDYEDAAFAVWRRRN